MLGDVQANTSVRNVHNVMTTIDMVLNTLVLGQALKATMCIENPATGLLWVLHWFETYFNRNRVILDYCR